MALTTCPECKNNISDLAEACPHCGYPVGGLGNAARDGSPAGKSRLLRLWRGEYPLRYAFWRSFFAVFFTVNVLIALFPGVLLRLILPPTAAAVGVILAAYLVYAAYLVICAVGVWRSASGYRGRPYLATAARVFVCCYLVSSLYLITSGFILPLLYLFRQFG